MPKHRRYNWPKLIQEFEDSGLTQDQFCKERDLNPKYFSLRRSVLCSTDKPAFEKVSVKATPKQATGLTVQVGRCQIQCLECMPIDSFMTLVNSVA